MQDTDLVARAQKLINMLSLAAMIRLSGRGRSLLAQQRPDRIHHEEKQVRPVSVKDERPQLSRDR